MRRPTAGPRLDAPTHLGLRDPGTLLHSHLWRPRSDLAIAIICIRYATPLYPKVTRQSCTHLPHVGLGLQPMRCCEYLNIRQSHYEARESAHLKKHQQSERSARQSNKELSCKCRSPYMHINVATSLSVSFSHVSAESHILSFM